MTGLVGTGFRTIRARIARLGAAGPVQARANSLTRIYVNHTNGLLTTPREAGPFMDMQPAFDFKELVTHIKGDVAKAVFKHGGKARQRPLPRSRVAAILGFPPRDAIEASLGEHCLMLHELMADSVREMLRGEMDAPRRTACKDIVAIDKAFRDSLNGLEHYQLRLAGGGRHARAVSLAETTEVFQPPRDLGNLDAKPALDAGDAEGFALAMGVATPSDAA